MIGVGRMMGIHNEYLLLLLQNNNEDKKKAKKKLKRKNRPPLLSMILLFLVCLVSWIIPKTTAATAAAAAGHSSTVAFVTTSSSSSFKISRKWTKSRSSSSESIYRKNIPMRIDQSSVLSLMESTTEDQQNEQQQQQQQQDEDDEKRKEEELLRLLDEKFSYEGRLPSMLNNNNTNTNTNNTIPFRCGYVGIVGAPNMGKSTLLNALLQIPTFLSVQSKRPQMTRHSILGILSSSTTKCQICFYDTPGILKNPSYKLQEGMMEAVRGTLLQSDVILIVTDLFGTPIPNDALFQRIQQQLMDNNNKSVIVVINKIDLFHRINPTTQKQQQQQQSGTNDDNDADDDDGDDVTTQRTTSVPDAIAKWRSLLPNALAIIPTIASDGPNDPGVEVLRRLLLGGIDLPAAIRALGRPIPGMFDDPKRYLMTDDEAREMLSLPQSPPLYDMDALTDRSERFFASEIIRASLFENFGKELPYCSEVQINEFKEYSSSSLLRITATIYVERESQKGIVIGKNGQKIKKVGIHARLALEEFFFETDDDNNDNNNQEKKKKKKKKKVHLDLMVKVDKDWRRDEKKLKSYGYLK